MVIDEAELRVPGVSREKTQREPGQRCSREIEESARGEEESRDRCRAQQRRKPHGGRFGSGLAPGGVEGPYEQRDSAVEEGWPDGLRTVGKVDVGVEAQRLGKALQRVEDTPHVVVGIHAEEDDAVGCEDRRIRECSHQEREREERAAR